MYIYAYNLIVASAITSGFINGADQIWLDEVQCAGTESRLIDCPASPLGQHDCSHSEDAGVFCLPAATPQGPTPPISMNKHSVLFMLKVKLNSVAFECSVSRSGKFMVCPGRRL